MKKLSTISFGDAGRGGVRLRDANTCVCRDAGAGKSHHRRVRLSLARRLHAAGDQGQEARRGERPRHRIRRTAADAYTTQFNSGEFKVGGSAAVLTVGLADARGVKVKYLFNLFDFWGAIVTSRPEIKSTKDLEGKQLAAAASTTNFVMSEFFAKQQGVDVSKIQVVNTAPPGLVGYAMADRADAVQLWEPAYTLLKARKPDIRMLDTGMSKTWQAFASGERIPYLGVAAHDDWIEQNQALIPKLYATYKAAGEFIAKNPEEAIGIIAAKSTPEVRAALVSLVKANDRLGMNVMPAGELRKQIDAVYKAGVDVGYFKSMPSNSTIYEKPMK